MKAGRPASERQRTEFDELYRLHSREVWALVYARTLKADLAMDAMQEAFLRLWKQFGGAEVIVNPRAWLLRVARNLAEDHAKSAFHRNGTQGPELFDSIAEATRSAHEILEREELFGCVRQEVAMLSVSDREILTLRYALDYETDRIAEVLQINPTAVHMRLSRARQRLADRLVERGVSVAP